MALSIKLALLKACSVIHYILSQIHLMHYRKKMVKLLKCLLECNSVFVI